MSNPTTKAATFNGNSDGFTVTGPERYSNGMWLEEAGTNFVTNPSAETNLTNISGVGGITPSRVAMAGFSGSYVVEVVCDGTVSWQGVHFAYDSTALAYTGQAYSVVGSLLMAGTGTVPSVAVWVHYTDGTSAFSATKPATLTATPTRYYSNVFTTNAAKTVDLVRVYAQGDTAPFAAYTAYCDAAQVEINPYPTSYIESSLGSGYSGSTGKHFRAASSAAISPAGILTPGSGAVAFRITPTIETGVEEIWGECGAKGSGTDHVRWGRDASKHPFCEWSANNAAYQRLTASETVDAGTAYDLYLGHDGTDVSLSVDAGTANTGTRASVSDSFGAGDLTLKASAGGVIYDEFATFDRTLTNSEIARLNLTSTWSIGTLGDATTIVMPLGARRRR